MKGICWLLIYSKFIIIDIMALNEAMTPIERTENARLEKFLAWIAVSQQILTGEYSLSGHISGKKELSGIYVPNHKVLLEVRQTLPASGHDDAVLHVFRHNGIRRIDSILEAQHFTNDNPFRGERLDWRVTDSSTFPELAVRTLPDQSGNSQVADIFLNFSTIVAVEAGAASMAN